MGYSPGLVSVIVPSYNAANFLPETIDSVKNQSYPGWEMIVVDDGSADNTAELIKNERDHRVKLLQQQNAGVSVARNNGLKKAEGEYVIFLDADDLMTPQFIEARLEVLQANPDLGFVGGNVETFPKRSETKKALGSNPEKEILFFDAESSTVPSNYMFRKEVLLQNNLWFNPHLSSTADRFFLLQVSKHSRGARLDGEKGKLLYRVSEHSMSHKISPKLLLDNEQFYRELIKENLLPVENRRKFKSLYFFSLGLGFGKIKHVGSFARYIAKSALCQPVYFSELLLEKSVQEKGKIKFYPEALFISRNTH